MRLSLEELMDMEMTSASRLPQRPIEIPAATEIISGQEIARSGLRQIPDALRLSSSVEVARIDARQYEVGVRGFNTTTSNKLLVMMDGRTIYTPLY
jgi:iron complex outermembrane receptor protein